VPLAKRLQLEQKGPLNLHRHHHLALLLEQAFRLAELLLEQEFPHQP
jgi:hypothetical protein